MKIKSSELLNDLIQIVEQTLLQLSELETRQEADLNRRPHTAAWSALECIEHLCLYSDFYLPELRRSISSGHRPARTIFTSGILGNYFAESMKPKAKLNKMKTFKDKNPLGRVMDKSVLERFRKQQNELLDLLRQAARVDLQKNKTAISISSLLKLRLGDTFRFLIYHQERHLLQAKKALELPEEIKRIETK